VEERFEILREVAQGGMGIVYEARDKDTGERVAVKCLLDSAFDTLRFERESELLASLEHPGLVRHIAHGTTNDDRPYLAMEWLDGEDLAARLSRGPLSQEDTIILAKRVTETLGVLHARHIVHRDIKPSNIFLRHGDVAEPVILDLGIARTLTRETRMTHTGTALGTPAYMAPEQARGESVDTRADVFSLGCVLFECAAGLPPFRGEHVIAILTKILLEDPPRLDESTPISSVFADVVDRMLKKSPDERFADAVEVQKALADVERRTSRPAPRLRAVTTAEKRMTSIVVCTANTKVAQTVDAPRPLLTQATAKSLVSEYGGELHALIHGTIVVTPPQKAAPTDQAVCAARCALALKEKFPESSVALATGMTEMAGPLPVGQAIDRAVQLLKNHRISREIVRLDEPSSRLLETRFEIAADGDARLLVRELENVDPARPLLGRPTPFVGRDRELAALVALLDECASESVARAILVTAPAGTGKSRLLREFLRVATNHDAAPEIWIARGDSVGAGSPLAMAGQIVRRAAGIIDGEPLEAKIEKLRARIAQFLENDLLHTVELLREIAGLPVPARDASEALQAARHDALAMSDALRAAWERWLDAECAQGPRVIVLEDLHWGDRPTVQFVDLALRNLPERPLLVLATARPEVHDAFPKLWADRGVSELKLGAVSKVAAEKLIKGILGASVAPERLRMIVQRAAGHPFLLEELIRAVAEGRADATLPEGVLGILQVRLDALAPEARRALRAASVFGETSWRGGITTLTGGDDGTLDQALETLVHKEFIAIRPSSTVAGEVEYAFRHALIRDAAYETLTDADRAAAHALAGEWLEDAGYGDALVLAEHYHRGSLPALAIGWYRKAAEQALDRNDLAGAIDRTERAIECGAQGEALGILEKIRADAHYLRGELGASKTAAERAISILPEASAEWFYAVGSLIAATGQTGDNDSVEVWGNRAASLLGKPDALDAQAIAICQAISQLAWIDRAEAVSALRAHLDALVGGRMEQLGALAAGWVERAFFIIDMQQMLLRQARDHADQAIAFFERAGARRLASLVKVVRCSIVCIIEPHRLQEELAGAISEPLRMGVTYIAGLARLYSIGFDLYLHNDTEVEIGAEQLLPHLRNSLSAYLTCAHFLCVAKGGLEKWQELLDFALPTIEMAPPGFQKQALVCAAARAAARLGDMSQATRLIDQVRVWMGKPPYRRFPGTVGLVIDCERAMGFFALNDEETAREILRPAVDLIRNGTNDLTDPAERAAFLACPRPIRAALDLAEKLGLEVPQ